MMYDKSRVIEVISKYCFLSEEQKRRILRGYCRVIGPVVYIYIYIGLGDPVRGQVNVIMEVRISE